jgi:Lamin Tail Domain/CotH kinase protein
MRNRNLTVLFLITGLLGIAAFHPAGAAEVFSSQDIGNLSPAGTVTPSGNGFNITTGGGDIGGTNDLFTFNYQTVTGDFDYKLRVNSLTLADTWAKAGLMARAALTSNSAYAATLATPSAAGSYFSTRATVGAVANNIGTFPVNYPNTWLRLKRAGDVFTGYASTDGTTWIQLGSLSVSLGNPISVGMAVTSRTNDVPVTAQLRDFQTASNAIVVPYAPEIEPPGPSSRLTPFAITEIMYNPFPNANSNVLEFVEIYNSNPFFEEIGGYRLSGDIDYTFPPDMVLQGGAYVVIARDPVAVQNVYGITGVLGPYATTNSLPGTGTLRLRNKENAVLLEVPYSSQPPWPAAADGAGHSLVLARASYGERDPYAWGISDKVGGSPGGADAQSSAPQRAVVINEFFANSEASDPDYIELYNHSNQAVDLTGCTLSDDPHTNKYVISGTIPARGFRVFYQTELNFGLSSGGETIYFRNADGTRVLDSIRFDAQAVGVSSGRFPDGAREVYPLKTRTPGAANDAILIRDIVINEIMYSPVTASADDEYVELYNKGTTSVNLAGWKFVSGINYTFGTNVVLAPNSYLVVAKNVSRMITNYSQLNLDNTFGDFKGSLRNKGDRVALAMPDINITTNGAGQVKTNTVYVVVDEVTYRGGGNWPKWANEGGSSLELIDPRSDHRLAQNWADSDETQKAPWTTVEATGYMDNPGVRNFGATPDAPDWVEILPMNDGEYLVDNYQIIHNSGQTNFLTDANSTFEGGLGGWLLRGTVIRSFIENTGGFGSGKCLHLVASARGDTMGNRAICKIPAVPTTNINGIVTLRAQVRWLHGWPEMLLRLRGNWFEAYGRLTLPSNLGTPGLPNSAAATNSAPALYDVKHAPVVPAANEPVVVTARVGDPDGPLAVTLKYRLDPATSYTTLNMLDNGTGGDAVAGDGIYTGTIPGQPTGTMVAFQVTATDAFGASRVFPNQYPYWPQPFDCMVRFGDPIISSSFATYRQWMSQSNVTEFGARPALSNEKLFETLVYGNFRAIYNAAVKWAGSPYHQFAGSPVTTAAHYVLDIPPDDLFLGTDSLNKIHAPGNGPFDDNAIQREQTVYWTMRKLGLPWGYRRFVNMYFNGNRRSGPGATPGPLQMMEDSVTPGSDLVDSYFPDDADGDLYKIQPWFEQGDPTSGSNNRLWASLNKFVTTNLATGQPMHKTAGYRHNFLVRSANGTANNFDPVFGLIDAAQPINDLPAMAANLSGIADMEEWFRVFAVNHSVGDWDHFGYRNSQNMYGYKTQKDKWKMLVWDMNIVLDSPAGPDGASTLLLNGNLTSVNGQDREMPFLYRIPEFRRMYLRALKEICTSVWVTNNYVPILDAKYAAAVASGVTPGSPAGIKTYIATARTTILNSIRAEDATNFLVTSSNAIDTTNDYVIVTGQAPFEAKTITVNGVQYSITWTNARSFSILVPVAQGNTVLNLQGFDLKGNALAGFTTNVTVNSTAQVPPPESSIVINEIMFNPLVPDAEYVELYNKSSFAYDLSGWRFNGLDYTFPQGAVITTRQYLVLVKNRSAFTAAYGATIPVFDQFDGNLQSGGETITLIKPGATPAEDVVIDKVRYEAVLPWPMGTNGIPTASSIQLIDASQDNSRPLNWSTLYAPAVYGDPIIFPGATNGGWRYATYTGINTSSSTNLFIFLGGAGDVYLDDMALVVGTVPETGDNVLINGDFELPLSPPDWIALGNHTNSVVSTSFSHSGGGSLHVIATGPGGSSSMIKQVFPAPPSNNTPYTLSYWFYSTTNSINLTTRTFPGSGFQFVTNVQVQVVPPYSLPAPLLTPALLRPTPGSNNIDTASLLAIPPLWLNELQASNTIGIVDNMGEREPWLELYNAGANELNLDSYYLADNYDTNLTQWQFPSGAKIAPGEFKIIWADGEPGETAGTNLHTSFRLAARSGTVALVRVVAGEPQVMDYLTYSGVGPGLTYGDFPDGQPFNRVTMRDATPGSTNIARPFNLYINEWLAGNTNTIADPADGQFDDWFEVYNPGTNAVDLGGLWFGDSSNSRFQVPTNGQYQIPAGGYLLVWADDEVNQNNASRPDLHVNFQLGKTADRITLYAADRSTIIDTVSFTNQVDDISEGRYPDGSLDIATLSPITPRAANRLAGANTAPVLTPIGTKVATLGRPFSFTITATDAQVSQTLTYSIVSGAPAGATLNPSSGLFSWSPAFSWTAGTNHVTVQVTDNGAPPLSDSETFTLIGLPPAPTLTVNGSQVTIGFQTIPGKTYRVEYKDDLNAAQWQRLNNQDYLAVGASLTVLDNLSGHSQRFYRIVQLD